MKNKICTLLSFLIPFLTYLLIFHFNSLFSSRFFMFDFFQQYYPLYNHLNSLLNGNANMFYNYTYNLGSTMYGAFFYYLSSPFNILILFVSKSNILSFMHFLIVLKLGLSGLTMYLFLHKKYKENEFLLLILSLCYAFMSYNSAYIINIMWLDVVLLAPIVLIGLENILDDKSPLIYFITLFICILSNYYISYMLCIFIVMYFIYELLLRYDLKKDKKIIKSIVKKFVINSLLAGLLCSFFLIPCILESRNYGRNLELVDYFKINFEYISIFPKMYLGTNGSEIISSNLYSPNIYCGIVILPLVYLYLVNKKINKKERKLTFFFILIFFLPCLFHGLNFIFHLFTNPIGFNYRYYFLLCLFMILIAYKSLMNLNISFNKILVYTVIYILITIDIFICKEFEIIGHFDYINIYYVLLSFIFLLIYFVLLKNIQTKNKLIILEIIICFELILNAAINISSISLLKRELLSNYYFEENKIASNNYRLYNNIDITYNDSMIYNNRDFAFNLSTDNGKKTELYNKTHINKMENHFSIMDDLLGANYIFIAKNKNINNYKKVDSGYMNGDKYNLYYNDNALSIGYIIKNKCQGIIDNNKGYYLVDQKILNCLINEKNNYYIDNIPYDKNEDEYRYIINKGYYVIYAEITDDVDLNEILSFAEDDILLSKYYTKFQYHIISNTQDEYNLVIKKHKNIKSIKVYSYDKELVDEKIKILAKEQLDYTIHKDYIDGTITTDGGILMLTIPYEKGFEIYVDDKKVPYYEVMDTFIGIDLKRGTHKIVIKYKQPGLFLGIIVSIMAFITSIIYYIYYYLKKKSS